MDLCARKAEQVAGLRIYVHRWARNRLLSSQIIIACSKRTREEVEIFNYWVVKICLDEATSHFNYRSLYGRQRQYGEISNEEKSTARFNFHEFIQ
ncbi:unnamed protein product [Victoria cruziana]